MEDETSVLELEDILNGAEEPKHLPLTLLKHITDDFSEDRKIGQGGFGEVYQGKLRDGVVVAVKRMYVNEHTVNDVAFRREVKSLMKINHQNVVLFLGFCSHAYHTYKEVAGSTDLNFINVRERLLCLEYINNGSLDKHINDELRGLEWETRYDIITGICKGLSHLKENKIIHMDLKPANILLDDHMIPKITDFGLSRPAENSHTMGQRFGTRGYFAPEYEKFGKTSFECDIYSLGIIIIELVTGHKGTAEKEKVLRRWRHRWKNPPTSVQCHQVTRCLDVAVRCRQAEPGHRPSISEIIRILSETARTDGHPGQESTYLDDDMLSIYPLELKHNEELSWLVKITNKTKACFAFTIEGPNKQYTIEPNKGIVTPEYNECTVQITMSTLQVTQSGDKFIMWSTKVSEGFRVEDITEHIFHEVPGKVVDDVDLIVVNEPTDFLKNNRSTEDTNMSADEVHEAKRRKIADSVSGKRKTKVSCSENQEATSNDIYSSMLGQFTKQTEQFNLHPLQSFSRNYPTNMTFLEKVNDRAVDHRMGCLGSLLDKLGKLLKEDYNLVEDIKIDIEFISRMLRMMHETIRRQGQLDGVKIWVGKVRELSYQIDDMVDSFLIHVTPDINGSGFKEVRCEGLKFRHNGTTSHHCIGDVVRDIKNQVQDVADMKESYNFDLNNGVSNATAKATIEDLRNLAIYEVGDQLVGIEAPSNELIRLFEQDGNVSNRKMKIVSVVGLGGLGKTTLAYAVYEKLQAQYQISAFVPVGQNPDVKKVLSNIISEFEKDFNAENLEVWKLTKTLQELLKNKRYFIVIDDIWESEAFSLITSSFPRNNNGSRVIITTRIEHVSRDYCEDERIIYRMKSLSEEDSRRLFFRRIFGLEKDCPDTPRKEEISKYILKKCGGMPLAIKSIASLLAGEEESTWEYICKSLGSVTEGDDLGKMKQILDLSYIHLPDHLKTCLLHVCMYSEDHEVDKNDLTRQWVAEGFVVSPNGQLDAQDVAEKYFKQLISMCMIQPGRIEDYSNEVLSCRVHDIIFDLMRSKSFEENFSHVTDGLETWAHGEIRRISVHCDYKEDSAIFERTKGSLSHARSALFDNVSPEPYLLEFKYVRVLHIEMYNKVLDFSGITRLFLLRYLKIDLSFEVLKLPDQIGELQHLETMDLKGCRLEKYPSDIVCLPWLSHLSYGGSRATGIALPEGVERLKSLRTLEGVRLDKSSAENIKGLGTLENLRRLKIHLGNSDEWQEPSRAMCMDALHSSISNISSSLRILTFGALYPPVDVPLRLSSMTLFPDGSAIRELNLSGFRFERCPGWISQLSNLHEFSVTVREVADVLNLVSGLSSLAFFRLWIFGVELEEQKEERVFIPGCGAFKALKELSFRCPKAALTFEPGALPKLEMLHMWFRYEMTPQFLPVGIQHLPAPTLKQIWLGLEEGSMEVKVKGSENWDDYKWHRYLHSDQYRDKEAKHEKKLRAMLKKAFKQHHPGADIYLNMGYEYSDEDDNKQEDDNNEEEDDNNEEEHEEFYLTEDDEIVDDEVYYSTEEDDEAAYQLNGSRISAHVHPDHTRQLIQLIEAQQDSGGTNITTDTALAPVVDTSPRLAVREGWQSGQGEDFSEDDDKREDCCKEEDDEAAYQVNESQTSAQVRADTRQLLQPSADSGAESIWYYGH